MRLGLFNLKRSEQDEMILLPVCSACGEVIADLDCGNAIVTYGNLDDICDGLLPDEVPAGTLDGCLLTKQRVEQLDAYHVQCDERKPGKLVGWMRLSQIFKLDQAPTYIQTNREENE